MLRTAGSGTSKILSPTSSPNPQQQENRRCSHQSCTLSSSTLQHCHSHKVIIHHSATTAEQFSSMQMKTIGLICDNDKDTYSDQWITWLCGMTTIRIWQDLTRTLIAQPYIFCLFLRHCSAYLIDMPLILLVNFWLDAICISLPLCSDKQIWINQLIIQSKRCLILDNCSTVWLITP